MATRDNIHLGDASNRAQSVVTIPAKAEANKPGVLNLQSVSGTTVSDRKLFITSGGTDLRVTTGTTFADSDGSSLVGGATTTLNNIASVAIPVTIASDAVNTDDVGTDALPWRSVYLGTNIVFDRGANHNLLLAGSDCATSARTVTFPDPGANVNVIYDTTSQALTTKTYNGMSVVAGSDAITLSQGTCDITMAAAASLGMGAGAALDIGASGNVDFSTGTYNFVGNIDIATSTAVDINQNVTISGGAFATSAACTIDQSLSTTDDPTFGALTVTSVTDGTATLTGGALSGISTLDTTSHVHLDADNAQLQLGNETTDAYIYFDGTHMQFYDTNLGATASLTDLASGNLASPTISGDATISDGKLTWNDGTNEVAGAWTFDSNTTANAINLSMDAATSGGAIAITNTGGTFTGNAVSVDLDAATSGTGYYVSILETTPMTGYYFRAHSGAADVFKVKRYGEIEITGNDTSDMLTITAGNLQLDDGIFEVDVDSNQDCYIKRNQATTTVPVLEIEATDASDDQPCLLIDHNNTGDVNNVEIQNAGTGYAVSSNSNAAGSGGFEFISATSGTGKGFFADGTTSGASWIGAANTGLIHASSDGALAETTTSLVYSTYTGDAGGADVTGTCGSFIDAGAASGTSFALYIDSTNNNGLRLRTLGTGKNAAYISGPTGQTASIVNIDTSTGANGWIGADVTGALQITGDNNLTHAGASMLYIAHSGTQQASALGSSFRINATGTNAAGAYTAYISSTNNHALGITTGAVDVAQLSLLSYADQTESMLILDGSTSNWLGASGNGMIELIGDGTFAHADTSMIKCTKTGATVASMEGSCLNISDASTGGSTSGYAAYISASGALDALQIADGVTALADAETITIASGKSVDALTIDQNDSANNKDSIVVTTAGTGYALKSTVEAATGGGHKFIGASEQTTAIVTIDGTTTNGWDGADGVGMLDINSDGTLVHAGASLVRIDLTGGASAASATGSCLAVIDNSSAGSGYSVYVNSTGNTEALHVDAGKCVFDEEISCSGGIDINADSVNLTIGAGDEFIAQNTGTATKFVLTGDLTVGDTTPTNYTKFTSGTGALSFAGTARPTQYLWFAPEDFAPCDATPKPAKQIVPTSLADSWAFDGTTSELAATSFRTPSNWASGTDLTVKIYYCANDANTKNVKWDVNTLFLTDGTDNASTGSYVTDTVTDTMAGAAYVLNVATVTVAAADVVADEICILKLERDSTDAADTLDGVDALLLGVEIAYTADSL